MKKIICLLLCFWLPLFFSAASYASTHMVSTNMISADIVVSADEVPMMQADNKMPDDCPMGKGSASGDMADHGTQDKTPHNKCQHCGFCASMAFYPVAAIVDGPASYHLLSSHIAWAPSSYLPPADQRPPITL